MLQVGKPKYSSNDFASGHNSENKTKSRKGNTLPGEWDIVIQCQVVLNIDCKVKLFRNELFGFFFLQ